MKKWSVGKPDPKISSELSLKSGLSQLCSSVLVSRGVDTIEKAQQFFNYHNDSSEAPLSDPFLLRDMREASDIILNAADNGDAICIYGDYDCDGITSTAILYSYLECMGANVSYHINMRSEGYGLCESAVRKLHEDGIKLIITVDNGISAVKEAELIAELGMTLVITDHHRPGETLPKADAVVNPHREDDMSPFKDLCGCGVVLKLIAAMDGGDYSAAMEQFSDLAAIASVADVVPLTGENREIVLQGLHYLENTENLGLQALINCSGAKKPITSVSLSYTIVPRINAAGRFGDASDAVKLFLADDEETAQEYAQKLDTLNSDRKATEAQIMADIEKRIQSDPTILYKKVLVIYGEGWHHGVVGIVAARLVDRFGKPAFVISDEGEEARGSARSVEGFSVFDALSHCSDILTKFGGHVGAGGFSLYKSRISDLDEALQDYAETEYEHMPIYTFHADKAVKASELNVESVSSLSSLEPFGEKNSKPTFLMHGACVLDIIPLMGGAHTKLRLNFENKEFEALMFGKKTDETAFRKNDILDLLFYPEINSYNGRSSVSLRVEDCRESNISQPKYFNAKEAYEKYKRGGGIDKSLAARIIPTRNELISVYRNIPREGKICCDMLFSRLDMNVISYCKFRIAIDIFEELGFILFDNYNDTVTIVQNAKKAEIESSEIYQSLLHI